LIPSVPYFVAVTAFDHGVPTRNINPMETRPKDVAQREFAHNAVEIVQNNNLNVVVYPNPYRVDENYRLYYEGWENPDIHPERQKALHFTNLPGPCTIRIFSIDGDLVDTIEHECADISEPGCMHETWDLVSRNDMAITSGIYYFQVDSEFGSEIGKFVIIY
jgi:hypothetical protein